MSPGKRSPDKSAVNVWVPTTLRAEAVAKATLEGKGLTELVEALLREYIAKPPVLADNVEEISE